MCTLCDENLGYMVTCPDCTRLICFDVKGVDDIAAPASVTSAGDILCLPCALRYEEEEAAEWDEWLEKRRDYPGDLLSGSLDYGEEA